MLESHLGNSVLHDKIDYWTSVTWAVFHVISFQRTKRMKRTNTHTGMLVARNTKT